MNEEFHVTEWKIKNTKYFLVIICHPNKVWKKYHSQYKLYKRWLKTEIILYYTTQTLKKYTEKKIITAELEYSIAFQCFNLFTEILRWFGSQWRVTYFTTVYVQYMYIVSERDIKHFLTLFHFFLSFFIQGLASIQTSVNSWSFCYWGKIYICNLQLPEYHCLNKFDISHMVSIFPLILTTSFPLFFDAKGFCHGQKSLLRPCFK